MKKKKKDPISSDKAKELVDVARKVTDIFLWAGVSEFTCETKQSILSFIRKTEKKITKRGTKK